MRNFHSFVEPRQPYGMDQFQIDFDTWLEEDRGKSEAMLKTLREANQAFDDAIKALSGE